MRVSVTSFFFLLFVNKLTLLGEPWELWHISLKIHCYFIFMILHCPWSHIATMTKVYVMNLVNVWYIYFFGKSQWLGVSSHSPHHITSQHTLGKDSLIIYLLTFHSLEWLHTSNVHVFYSKLTACHYWTIVINPDYER